MPVIDYMKVIDIISDIFSADHQVKLKTTGGKVQTFEVETSMSDGSVLSYRMELKQYDISVCIDKKYFIGRDTRSVISKLEYLLEQEFFKNIKLDMIDDGTKNTITISV